MKLRKTVKKPATPEKEDISVEDFRSSAGIPAAVLEKLQKLYLTPQSYNNYGILPDPGLVPGTLTVICSMPSVGKSAYLVNLAVELQKQGKNVAIFLPDHTAEEFIYKALIVKSKVSLSGMRMSRLKYADWPAMAAAAKVLNGPGLYFFRRPVMSEFAVAQGAAEISKELHKKGRRLDAVLVDSLNYVAESDWGAGRLPELRKMAAALNTTVFCAYAMQETKKTINGWISLADVRATGLDESQTDMIFHLRRAEFYNREDIILKNKATLYCVYSAVPGARQKDLYFYHETLRFSPPVINSNPD